MNNSEYDENKITVLKADTFFEMMELLRTRPKMYLGNKYGNNFIALTSFLSGYQFRNTDEDYHNFFMWFACNIDTTSLPIEYIEETYKEKAYEKFWEFYDMYLESILNS